MDQPGVYLLAHFGNSPAGETDPKAPEIIYIGETHGQTLKERLRNFHRSAFESKEEHTGGETYRGKFPGDRGGTLYVSVYPPKVLISQKLHPTCIMYLEGRLRWGYAEANHRLPVCNKE